MTEREWVEQIAKRLATGTPFKSGRLEARPQAKLVYGCEIRRYGKDVRSPETKTVAYTTDLLIVEPGSDGTWVPRVVIEAKYSSVTTHDAITYSEKAGAHRAVHPHLRYGIMLGDRKEHPLPWRLLSHGHNFDFMFSFKGSAPTAIEWRRFTRLISDEVKASCAMERIVYNARSKDRDRFTVLHRKLVLE